MRALLLGGIILASSLLSAMEDEGGDHRATFSRYLELGQYTEAHILLESMMRKPSESTLFITLGNKDGDLPLHEVSKRMAIANFYKNERDTDLLRDLREILLAKLKADFEAKNAKREKATDVYMRTMALLQRDGFLFEE